MVSGNGGGELSAKPAPVTFSCVTTTLWPPVELSRATVWVTVDPSDTLPKLREPGSEVICPGPRPVPSRPTDKLGLMASLVTDKDPLAGPTACGVKVMPTG